MSEKQFWFLMGLSTFRFYDSFVIIVRNISVMHAVSSKLKDTDGYKFEFLLVEGSGLRCTYHCSKNMHCVCSLPHSSSSCTFHPSINFVLVCTTLQRNMRDMDCHQSIILIHECNSMFGFYSYIMFSAQLL